MAKRLRERRAQGPTGAYTSVTRIEAPKSFGMPPAAGTQATAPSINQQIAVARSGATGLMGPTFTSGPIQAPTAGDVPRGGILGNEATLRALSRGATARGARLRRHFEKADLESRQRKAQQRAGALASLSAWRTRVGQAAVGNMDDIKIRSVERRYKRKRERLLRRWYFEDQGPDLNFRQ